jgi:hypothetical protein
MKVKKGDRVGAFLSKSHDQVELLGYGVYEGDYPPFEYEPELLNPRIKLDSGEIVWGMQCWWASEEAIKNSIKNLKIINVKVPEL